MLFSRALCFTGLLLLIPLVGCHSGDEIKVYRVPKEGGPVFPPARDPHGGVPMPTPGAGDPHAGLPTTASPGLAAKPTVEGEVPASWQPGGGSSMRLASYVVKGEGAAVADISLITLAGQAGGLLDNVNRWRAQIGLAPVDEHGLAESSEKITTPLGEAVVVDLEAPGAGADSGQDGRIVAAIVPLAKEMWFYKMRGNRELLGREKEGFLRWVASARMKEELQMPPKNRPAGAPQKDPVIPRGISWQVPDGWQEGPAQSMRVATFLVSGAGGSSGEVTVARLGGDAGGDLANVNRWRGQIGLEPISEEELATSVTSVDSRGGAIAVIDCAGSEKRAIAGWLRRDGSSWFFKLSGPSGLVEVEQVRFMSFLSSVDFPPK